MQNAAPVELTGRGVHLGDVVRVARSRAPVHLHAEARARVVAARAVVDRLVASDTPIYGLTSALGANTGQAIPQAERDRKSVV